MPETTLLEQFAQALAKAGIETICSYDATTMTSSLLVTKENRRLLQKQQIQLDFSDLEGRCLCDISAQIAQCEMKPVQPCQ